jgi:ABC-type Mn2+/Zn2+ transport system permease subunit
MTPARRVGILLAALAVAALAASARGLTLAGFDPIAAPSLGAHPGRARTILLALLALTTLIAVQALGNLLVVAILIAPAAAALRIQSRLLPALVTAGALAVLAGVGGIYVSYFADTATGASIALVAIAEWALTLPLRRRPAAIRAMVRPSIAPLD